MCVSAMFNLGPHDDLLDIVDGVARLGLDDRLDVVDGVARLT